jgi:hypothetical protein
MKFAVSFVSYHDNELSNEKLLIWTVPLIVWR